MALFKCWREQSNEQAPSQREAAGDVASSAALADKGPVSAEQQHPPTAHFPSEGPYCNSEEQLWHALAWVEQLVRAQTVRWRSTIAASKPQQMWGMVHVTDAEVEAYLATPFMAPEQLPPLLECQLGPYWHRAAEVVKTIAKRRDETRADVALRLDRLTSLFELGTLDLAVLLVCLLPALDVRYRRLYGYLQDDASRTRPNVELVRQVVWPLLNGAGQTHDPFNAQAPLGRHRLLLTAGDVRGEEPLAARSLRVDDRIVEYLLGSDRLDGRLRDIIDEPPLAENWGQLVVEQALLDRLQGLSAHLASLKDETLPALFLRGVYGSGRRLAARLLACSFGRALLVVDVPRALQASDPWHVVVDLSLREARLRNAVLLWHNSEILLERDRPRDNWEYLLRRLEDHPGLAMLTSTTPWEPAGSFRRRPFLRLEFAALGYRLRRQSWLAQLPSSFEADQRDNLASALANGFQLSSGQLADAIATAQAEALARDPRNPVVQVSDLYEGCRRQSSRGLVSYARLIEPRSGLTFDDLILPDVNKRQLDELRSRIQHRSQVFTEMGFERRLSLGRGLIALFTGSSGTGKTMSAELIGRAYGMQLFKVDLAAVVSKYVGETEKNLAQVFREAEDANAVLFFDEGEALFGKRGEVKEARDRWANIEVNYLLQRVEEYAGVVILATNFRQNMDPAFLRRIHVIVDFPRPDADARFRIWRGMFPDGIHRPPDEELRSLAEQFNLVGGSIKNAVLDGAFRALAENSSTITLRHLVLGVAREHQKLGNALTRGDFGEEFYLWVEKEIL